MGKKKDTKSKLPKRKPIPKYKVKKKEWASWSTKEKELHLRNFRKLDNGNGWHPLEAAAFHLILKKFGCGSWETMSYYLPHKNTAQFNVFCQKLFGQQSLYNFSRLKVDPYRNYKDVCKKLALRKSGVVVHEGIPLSTAEKKRNKDVWRKLEHEMPYDIPVVEDRSRNYTKLWWQMEATFRKIKEEAAKRGRLNEVLNARNLGPNHHKDVDHTKWMDKVYQWPKPTVWDVDAEFQCQKGQDNPWPLIRMVEDEDWYRSDQMLTWNWINGKIFADPTYRKQFQTKKTGMIVQKDLSLAGIDYTRLKGAGKQKAVKKAPKPNPERKPMELELNKFNAFGAVSTWTCDQLIQYLSECGLPPTLISKVEKERISGKKAFNLGLDEANKLFEESAPLMEIFDKAMMGACRKFGFEPKR